jgi:hypothetical protein
MKEWLFSSDFDMSSMPLAAMMLQQASDHR